MLFKDKYFNLVDEPWIAVMFVGGTTDMVSLSEVFSRAGEILDLLGESPTQRVSVLQFLLSILHRCSMLTAQDGYEGDPVDLWADLMDSRNDGFSAVDVLGYLDSHHEDFWLVSQEKPFMQMPSSKVPEEKQKCFGPLHEIRPTGKKAYSFNSPSSSLAMEKMPLGMLANWIVRRGKYDTCGIHIGGQSMKATHCTGCVTAMMQGATLAETLCLNTVLSAGLSEDGDMESWASFDDVPIWEYDEPWSVETDVLGVGRARLYSLLERVTSVRYEDVDGVPVPRQLATFLPAPINGVVKGHEWDFLVSVDPFSLRTFKDGKEALSSGTTMVVGNRSGILDSALWRFGRPPVASWITAADASFSDGSLLSQRMMVRVVAMASNKDKTLGEIDDLIPMSEYLLSSSGDEAFAELVSLMGRFKSAIKTVADGIWKVNSMAFRADATSKDKTEFCEPLKQRMSYEVDAVVRPACGDVRDGNLNEVTELMRTSVYSYLRSVLYGILNDLPPACFLIVSGRGGKSPDEVVKTTLNSVSKLFWPK